MAKLKYQGSIPTVSLSWGVVLNAPQQTGDRCKIKRGDVIEVTDEAAKSLLASGNFVQEGKKKEGA
ncbi:MAG: hypothetical protein HOO67_06175 [Candidatus Peribacteraceae bacterium]|nr:hypothetical protein [Candidatus Peribacteraceae bacterium]